MYSRRGERHRLPVARGVEHPVDQHDAGRCPRPGRSRGARAARSATRRSGGKRRYGGRAPSLGRGAAAPGGALAGCQIATSWLSLANTAGADSLPRGLHDVVEPPSEKNRASGTERVLDRRDSALEFIHRAAPSTRSTSSAWPGPPPMCSRARRSPRDETRSAYARSATKACSPHPPLPPARTACCSTRTGALIAMRPARRSRWWSVCRRGGGGRWFRAMIHR